MKNNIIYINEKTFPDRNFRNYIKQSFDKEDKGFLLSEEIRKIEEMFIDEMGISDLTGIEHFESLTSLTCNDNKLSSLNLSENRKLVSLKCKNNGIKDLRLDENNELSFLDCSYNQLDQINLSKNIGLHFLNCTHNQMKEIDLSENVNLKQASCYSKYIKKMVFPRELKRITRYYRFDYYFSKDRLALVI